jgi:hypothetical protein
MRFKNMILATLIALTSLFVMPTAAEAKTARVGWNGRVVEIVSNLPASWSVKSAMNDIDWYTGSDLRLVKKCSGKNRCIMIVKGSVAGAPVGWVYTCRSTAKLCTIKIDVNKAALSRYKKWYGMSTKRYLIRHELGHMMGLHDRKACDSTMNPYVRCRGHVPPNTFAKSERSVLVKK